MNALLLTTVFALSLGDASRTAALLQEPQAAPSSQGSAAVAPGAGGEATPMVAAEPAAGTVQPALPGGATLEPSASAVAAQRPGALMGDVDPGRIRAGIIAGGVAVVLTPVAVVVASFLALRSGQTFLSTLSDSNLILYALTVPVMAGWVTGPLAAGLAMGAGPVVGRLIAYSLLGALVGVVTLLVPPVGVFLYLAGPTLGALYAVMTSPAEAFGLPGKAALGSAAPGPLLSFRF